MSDTSRSSYDTEMSRVFAGTELVSKRQKPFEQEREEVEFELQSKAAQTEAGGGPLS